MANGQAMSATKEQYLRRWLRGVQVLTMLSAATSAATMMHEWGYARYWRIPDIVVRLTPELIIEHSLFKAVAWIAIALVTHFMFKQDLAVLDRHLLSKGASRRRRAAARAFFQRAAYAPATALLLIELLKLLEAADALAHPDENVGGVILGGIALSGVAGAMCWVLYVVGRHSDTEGNAILLLLLLAGVFGSWVDGWRDGKKQQDFTFAHNGARTFVALRVYNDKLVARPIADGCTEDETLILNGSEVTLTLGHVDKLRLCPGTCRAEVEQNRQLLDDSPAHGGDRSGRAAQPDVANLERLERTLSCIALASPGAAL